MKNNEKRTAEIFLQLDYSSDSNQGTDYIVMFQFLIESFLWQVVHLNCTIAQPLIWYS